MLIEECWKENCRQKSKGLTIITRVIELFFFVSDWNSTFVRNPLLASRLKHLKKKKKRKKKKPTKWKRKRTKSVAVVTIDNYILWNVCTEGWVLRECAWSECLIYFMTEDRTIESEHGDEKQLWSGRSLEAKVGETRSMRDETESQTLHVFHNLY